MKKLFVIVLIISLIVPIILLNNINNYPNLQTKQSTKKLSENSYSIHDKSSKIDFILNDPVYIYGDDNLTATASLYGWSGNGTENFPYILENILFNFSDFGLRAITVQNTSLYLKISNNLFISSSRENIVLQYASNVIIAENIFNYTLKDNIKTYSSEKIQITNNNFTFCDYIAIEFYSSDDILIKNNNFDSNENNGIRLESCNRTEIRNNIISNNKGKAISIDDSQNTLIKYNKISNNSITSFEGAISISSSKNNTIIHNNITNNNYFGLQTNMAQFTIKWNNFVDNYRTTYQYRALNPSPYDVMSYNYWSDWVEEDDLNNDNIIDIAYGKDEFPMKELNFIGKIASPSLKDIRDNKNDIWYLSINKNLNDYNLTATISNDVSVYWYPAVDSLGYVLRYSLYYSVDYSNDWILVTDRTYGDSYPCNITNANNNSKITFKIVVTNEMGRSVEYISNIMFIYVTDSNNNSNSSTSTDSQAETNSYTILQLFFAIGIITFYKKKRKKQNKE